MALANNSVPDTYRGRTLLVIRKPLRPVDVVGDEEPRGDPHQHRRKTLDEEDEAPL